MLTPSPSICERLLAAVNDKEEVYTTVYYKRVEGATTEAIRIASQDKDGIVIMNVADLRWLYRDADVNFVTPSANAFPRRKIIIADVLPQEVLKGVRRNALECGCRLIAIKSID
jgi:hypothetical protein